MRPGPEAPFREPWEAQAFALAVELSDKGVFEWREFSLALGSEIKAAEAQGRDEPYYALWLAALEKLLAGKGRERGRRRCPRGVDEGFGRASARALSNRGRRAEGGSRACQAIALL